MPTISLTDFVDIVSKSGSSKMTKIAQVKRRPAYSPQSDFYKPIREAIIDKHAKGLPLISIAQTIRGLTDRKKLTNYPDVEAGHRRWLGRKQLSWFSPAASRFSDHGFDVRVNPELGVIVNGVPHLIKLYFKSEPMTRNRVQIAVHLMETSLRRNAPEGAVMSILDTRQGKLLTPSSSSVLLTAGLRAELAYIAALWPSV